MQEKKRNPYSEVKVQRLAEGKRTEEKHTEHDPNSTTQNKYNNLPKLF